MYSLSENSWFFSGLAFLLSYILGDPSLYVLGVVVGMFITCYFVKR
jgi:hypothetical protein